MRPSWCEKWFCLMVDGACEYGCSEPRNSKPSVDVADGKGYEIKGANVENENELVEVAVEVPGWVLAWLDRLRGEYSVAEFAGLLLSSEVSNRKENQDDVGPIDK